MVKERKISRDIISTRWRNWKPGITEKFRKRERKVRNGNIITQIPPWWIPFLIQGLWKEYMTHSPGWPTQPRLINHQKSNYSRQQNCSNVFIFCEDAFISYGIKFEKMWENFSGWPDIICCCFHHQIGTTSIFGSSITLCIQDTHWKSFVAQYQQVMKCWKLNHDHMTLLIVCYNQQSHVTGSSFGINM